MLFTTYVAHNANAAELRFERSLHIAQHLVKKKTLHFNFSEACWHQGASFEGTQELLHLPHAGPKRPEE
jgi:hypothetical protein